MLRIAKFARAGEDEELRHLLRVHVLPDRVVRRRPEAEARENQQDSVVFDKFASLLDRLGRAVSIIVGNELDFPAVDAAIGIKLF